MRDAESFDYSPPGSRRVATRAQARLILISAAMTALACMGICAAAILVPAPAAVVPLVVTSCIGAPLFAGWEAPVALASVRADRSRRQALTRLRRSLAQLPEVEHPHGF
jgi:hypothetical protein